MGFFNHIKNIVHFVIKKRCRFKNFVILKLYGYKDVMLIHVFDGDFSVIRSAHLISAYRPRCPILAITRIEQTARQCHLFRGIFPIHYVGKLLEKGGGGSRL